MMKKTFKKIFPNMPYSKFQMRLKQEKGDVDTTLHSLGLWSWEHKKERAELKRILKKNRK